MTVNTNAEIRISGELLRSIQTECEERLRLLQQAEAAELKKPVAGRSVQFLLFLDKERSVYTFGLSLLARLQDPAASTAREDTFEVRA